MYNAHQWIHTTIARVVVAAFDSKTAAIDTNIFTVCLSLFLLFCKTVKFNAPWPEIYYIEPQWARAGAERGGKGTHNFTKFAVQISKAGLDICLEASSTKGIPCIIAFTLLIINLVYTGGIHDANRFAVNMTSLEFAI